MRDIALRFEPRHGGCAVLVEIRKPKPSGDFWKFSSKYMEDWYPGSVRDAVVAARAEYPGCRIAQVRELEWHHWIENLNNWSAGDPY